MKCKCRLLTIINYWHMYISMSTSKRKPFMRVSTLVIFSLILSLLWHCWNFLKKIRMIKFFRACLRNFVWLVIIRIIYSRSWMICLAVRLPSRLELVPISRSPKFFLDGPNLYNLKGKIVLINHSTYH